METIRCTVCDSNDVGTIVHDHTSGYCGDFVVCCNCGQHLLLPIGSEICPNCNKPGGLVWVNKQQESNVDLLKSTGYNVKSCRQLDCKEYLTVETLKDEFGITGTEDKNNQTDLST